MNLPRGVAEVVGTGHVLSDPELKSSYEPDYTGRYDAPARVMVRPAATHDRDRLLARPSVTTTRATQIGFA